jgi:proline iminopeptidase
MENRQSRFGTCNGGAAAGRTHPSNPVIHFLQVSPLHRVYFEECGNRSGVFVHGAWRLPRSRGASSIRALPHLTSGCGRSMHAELTDNTTRHPSPTWNAARAPASAALAGVRWIVGLTLALAYAQTHPDRVSELVLRGIFMLRRWELEWFYQKGCDAIFPMPGKAILRDSGGRTRRPDGRLLPRLTSADAGVHGCSEGQSMWRAVRARSRVPTTSHRPAATSSPWRLRARCHYFVHGGFFDADDQLLRDAHRLKRIPAVVIQGRYDVVCPIRSAWDLHRAWPEADLRIVGDAGHSALEPGITHELVSATDRFLS